MQPAPHSGLTEPGSLTPQSNPLAPAPWPLAPKKIGALLFTSGYVLEGEAVLQGESYHVKSKMGSSRHPKKLVEYEAADLQDAYRYMRNKIDLADYGAVVGLAQWCKKTGLKEETITEYERAKLLAPNPEAVAMIDSILRLERRPFSRYSGASEPAQTPEYRPNGEDFDYGTWRKALPSEVLDGYARTVQPILLKRCGSADCHGETSPQQFKLERLSAADPTTGTLRNLRMVFEYFDLDKPYASPILRVATEAHGGLDAMYGPQSQAHFVDLYNWTTQTAQKLTPPVADKLQIGLLFPARTMPDKIQQMSAQESKPAPAHVQNPKPARPDPFDPGVFNEMYHNQ